MSMNQQKKLHLQKTNHHASIRILFLITLLICNGYQIYLDNTYQIIFILFQGLLLVSLFAPLHECSHSTAFKSKFLNQAVMFFCGMVHLMPSIWFKEFHMEHHRHTQNPTMDPELWNESPRSIGSYLFLISGIRIWIDLIQNFFRLFSGNVNQSYIKKRNIQKVILEVRFLFGIYLLLLFLSFNSNNSFLLNGWIIPKGLEVLKAEIRNNGNLIYDAKKSPLGVPALSESFEGQLTLEELIPHLFTAENADAIPYHWNKLYRPGERLWGFCIPKKIKD